MKTEGVKTASSKVLDISSVEQFINREERLKAQTFSSKRLGAAGQPIDDRQHTFHLKPEFADPLDCSHRTPTGGDDVFQNDAAITRFDRERKS